MLFKTKWPKSEEKHEFGSRWVGEPLQVCPPPRQNEIRHHRFDRPATLSSSPEELTLFPSTNHSIRAIKHRLSASDLVAIG